jgi:predicted lipoprotein with Yx(FWY)xxD motif
MKRFVAPVAALAVVAALAIVGLGSAAAGVKSAQKSVTVSTRSVKGLGQILVDSRGRTLYMFMPDKQKKVTCTSASCVAAWPPLKLPAGAKAAAAGKAKQALLSSDPNPKGGKVVTYARWPLYTYIGDSKPGQASGQALNLNGGVWYVLSPSGTVIKKKT